MRVTNILKLKADELFWRFENSCFQNSGNYPRNTNLILEFSDFIAELSSDELQQWGKLQSRQEAETLKEMINTGIDVWLSDGRIKTLMY